MIFGKGVWWIKPYSLIFCFIIPVYIFLFFSCISPKYGKYYFNFEYFLLGLAFLCVLANTSYITARITSGRTTKSLVKPNPLFLDFIAATTVMAYCVWFRDVFTNPELFTQIVIGLSLSMRSEVSTIPGLTTLSQLGVVYSIFYSCYKWVWNQKLSLRYSMYFWVLILLVLFRTVAWSERLAIIEVVLPVALVYLSFAPVTGKIHRLVILLGPYLGILFLVVFFGIFEFFRSWGAHQASADSFVSFMTDRLVYYYFSAMNNGAGLLTEFPWPQFDGQSIMKWIYTFPGLGETVSQYMAPSGAATKFVQFFADTEFNTYTGIFPVYYDVGIVGGLIYAMLLGIVIGYCYKKFQSGTRMGLILYPVFFIHLAEVLRILYITHSRTVPIFLFLIIGYWLVRKREKSLKVENG